MTSPADDNQVPDPSNGPESHEPPADDIPAVEDASTPAGPDDHSGVEDEPELLDPTARSLELSDDSASAAVAEGEASAASSAASETDGTSDTASITDDSDSASEPSPDSGTGDWLTETSAHRIVVELKRIETDVRALLEGRDPRRKRKLGGTSRWLELEDDLIRWRFTGRWEESSLRRLQELVQRRHHLFTRLRFVASTRPTWNS